VYRSESGVGSVLILRLRHARRTGQQILVKSSGAPHKTFIFMPRVTANTSPATLPMALVGPRPGQLSLARCPAPTHHARPHLPRSPDPVHTMRPRDRATTSRPTTGPGWPADRPRQAPDGTGCADRPLAPGRARRRPAPDGSVAQTPGPAAGQPVESVQEDTMVRTSQDPTPRMSRPNEGPAQTRRGPEQSQLVESTGTTPATTSSPRFRPLARLLPARNSLTRMLRARQRPRHPRRLW